MMFRMFVCGACNLRFPAAVSEMPVAVCPACGGRTKAGEARFSRHAIPKVPESEIKTAVHAVLDNIRSAWNVGAMFRTADAAGVRHIYLCGITPTPENPKVRKTSLGSERSVSWSHHPDGVALVKTLQAQGKRIWALEGGAGAHPVRSAPVVDEVTWVIGNENAGVDPAVLEVCDRVFYLPMVGDKESLNVVIAFGVAVYLSGFY